MLASVGSATALSAAAFASAIASSRAVSSALFTVISISFEVGVPAIDVAVIIVLPPATAVTTPSLIVATDVSELFQVTLSDSEPYASTSFVIVAVSPIFSSVLSAAIVIATIPETSTSHFTGFAVLSGSRDDTVTEVLPACTGVNIIVVSLLPSSLSGVVGFAISASTISSSSETTETPPISAAFVLSAVLTGLTIATIWSGVSVFPLSSTLLLSSSTEVALTPSLLTTLTVNSETLCVVLFSTLIFALPTPFAVTSPVASTVAIVPVVGVKVYPV